MDAKQEAPIKRSVEDVFRDFQGRRDGLIKALTTDFHKFYQECDPEKDNLCLYGLPDGSWEVNLPIDDVPPALPEPILGINFAKEGMCISEWLSIVAIHGDAWLMSVAFYFAAGFNFDKNASDWLSLVAIHDDAWLMSVAFYFGAYFMFDKNDRKRLFQLINGLPNVFEVVTAKQPEQLSTNQRKGNQTKPSGKMPQSQSFKLQPKGVKMTPPSKDVDSDEEEEEADEQGTSCCGACGDDNGVDEFWICCDVCEIWYHGQCVKVTPAKAEHIKQYKCPTCSNKKARVH